jgi:hypothetical protein
MLWMVGINSTVLLKPERPRFRTFLLTILPFCCYITLQHIVARAKPRSANRNGIIKKLHLLTAKS